MKKNVKGLASIKKIHTFALPNQEKATAFDRANVRAALSEWGIEIKLYRMLNIELFNMSKKVL